MRPLAATPSTICRRESFLSGSHFSAVFARFSRLSPPFGSLVAYPVGSSRARVVVNGSVACHASLWLPQRGDRPRPFVCAMPSDKRRAGGSPSPLRDSWHKMSDAPADRREWQYTPL